MEDYMKDFIDGDDVFPVSRTFVIAEVIPRVSKVLEEVGDGWVEDLGAEIHTREIEALLQFAQNKCE